MDTKDTQTGTAPDQTTNPPTESAETKPGSTGPRFQCHSIRPESIFTGFKLHLMSYDKEAGLQHHEVVVKIHLSDMQLHVTAPDNLFISVGSPIDMPRYTTMTEAEAKPFTSTAPQNVRTAERIITEARRLVETYEKMVNKTKARIKERWNRDVPDAVIQTCMRLDYYAIDRLEWAGDHYYVMSGTMYIGIEENGYAHT